MPSSIATTPNKPAAPPSGTSTPGHETAKDSWLVHPELCGRQWQLDYRKLHDDIMSGKAPREQRKYVVTVPVRAGGADIMLGMISLFLYALLTNRAFLHTKILEEGFHAPIIEHAYKPSTFNWIAPPEIPRNITFCLWPPYDSSMGNKECDERPQKFLPHDKHDSTFYHHFMVNSYQEQYFWYGNYSNMFENGNSDKDVISFASNRGNVYRTFFNPYMNGTLHKMGLHKENAFACIYNFLFASRGEVCDTGCHQAKQKIQQIKKDRRILNNPNKDGYHVWSTMLIGIQVRDSYLPGDYHFHCVEGLVADYKKRYGVEDFYYIFINGQKDVQKVAYEKYQDRVIFPTGGVSNQSISDVLGESEQPNANAPAKIKAVLESARDWDVMALADVHVVSSRGGFGVMGSMMRVRLPKEYRMYHVRDERRECTIDSLDDLMIYTTQWSGLRRKHLRT